ncbi:MAG: hypothetical protein GX666_08070 [Tissierellia bacterium]|nr:hypothetical protein [Tissierellia bacterium]
MIFRQEILQKKAKQIKQKKKKNEKNRVRNKILNFRVSPEELDVINKMVEISGLNKQEYFVSMLTDHEVIVYADYRTEDVISKELFQLARVIKKYGKLDDDKQDILLYILEIYEAIKINKAPNPED